MSTLVQSSSERESELNGLSKCFVVFVFSVTVLELKMPLFIACPIQDDIPELNEVFLVNLTSVQILQPATTETPPRLGEKNEEN